MLKSKSTSIGNNNTHHHKLILFPLDTYNTLNNKSVANTASNNNNSIITNINNNINSTGINTGIITSQNILLNNYFRNYKNKNKTRNLLVNLYKYFWYAQLVAVVILLLFNIVNKIININNENNLYSVERVQLSHYVVTTRTRRLNVREEPNTNARVISQLENGVIVSGKPSLDPNWIEILDSDGKVIGYASSTFLRLVE